MRVKMDFQGGALALFGYTLLAGISVYALIIVLAWGYALLFAFIARNIRLSDGNTVTFHGRGAEIWWIVLLMVLPMMVPQVFVLAQGQNPRVGPLFFILLLIGLAASFYFAFLLTRWMINSVEFSWGGRCRFQGGSPRLLGWILLMYISAVLIIVPFWVISAMFRWLCDNTVTSEGDRIVWTGSGWGILWRTILLYLGSMLIIPIPWLLQWWTKWFIGCIEIERNAVAATQPAMATE